MKDILKKDVNDVSLKDYLKWNARQKEDLKRTVLTLLIVFAISIVVINVVFSYLVSASLGYYKINDCVNIKTILNTSAVNISSISFPNSSTAETNIQMTKNGMTFNYSFCSTPYIGNYIYDYFDAEGNVYVNDFTITNNGKEPASSGVIVLFSILIIIVLLSISYVIIYSIGHAVTLDFDIIDLAWNYGLFFAFVGTYFLQDYYLANEFITNIMNWGIYIGIFTNMFLPTVYFILTLTVGTWMQQRVKGVDF